MSRPDIWMPFYIGDYLADTGHLARDEDGGYVLLLFAAWTRGGKLPGDDAQLARLAKATPAEWKRLRPVLAPFFTVTADAWIQERLLREFQSSTERKAKAEAKAVAGAIGKWGASAGERGRALRSERMAAARLKGTHTAPQWAAMLAFHAFRCARCAAGDVEIVKDHVEPIYQGGSDAIENLQPLCRTCNASKGPEAIDHRKNGWQDACLMPATTGNECLPDACPPSSSSSIKSKARTRAARKARTSLPEGFAISERVKTWATVKGHGRLDQHLEAFLGKVAANGYVYADWDDAFMNCIREDWGKVNSGKPVSLVASHASHAPAKVPELGPHTEMPDAIREQLAQFVATKVAAR